jgi:A/G-specific adenine glycosylase
MLEPPMGPWTDAFPSKKEALLQAPFRAAWAKRAGIVRHGFTHFELEIEVYVAQPAKRPRTKSIWVARARFGDVALPTVMRKVIAHALDDGGPLFAQASSARMR